MNFFLSPFATLGSKNFYQRASRESIGKALLFLVYFCAVLNLAAAIWMNAKWSEPLDSMVERVIQKLPVMTMAEEGLSIDKPSPYVVPIIEVQGQQFLTVTFDTSKDRFTNQELADLPETSMWVTKKALYVNQRQGLRVVDFDKERQKNPGKFQPFTLDLKTKKSEIFKTLGSAKGVLSLIWIVMGTLLAFVLGLIGALFYSLLGLLINLLRANRLRYEGILSLAIYAMTPAALVAIALLFFHFKWFAALMSGWMNFLITLGYLIFAIKGSEENLGPVSS